MRKAEVDFILLLSFRLNNLIWVHILCGFGVDVSMIWILIVNQGVRQAEF